MNKTFSCMWSEELGRAIRIANTKPYSLEFHQGSEDYEIFAAAVEQGIDSHLEAIQFFQDRGECGRMKFDVTANTLPVLVRRLLESCSDSAVTLASDICSTLDIELI